MKKILLSLGTLASIAAPTAAVVSCGSEAKQALAKAKEQQQETTVEQTNEETTGTQEVSTETHEQTQEVKEEVKTEVHATTVMNEALFNDLHNKQDTSQIMTGDKGYDNLYNVYEEAFKDTMYENDGTIVDIYSENPTAADPFVINKHDHGYHSSVDDRSAKDTYHSHRMNEEGYETSGNWLYNREHLVPQSTFGKADPMKNDPNFVWPTNGHVNTARSRKVFGEVSDSIQPYLNEQHPGMYASKMEGNTFEPIDEFKGDVARAMFYFQLTYHGKSNFAPFTESFPYFKNDYLAMYLRWAKEDPVDAFDKQRNDVIQRIYGVSNPFISNPELLEQVFGQSDANAAIPAVGTAEPSFWTHHTTTHHAPAQPVVVPEKETQALPEVTEHHETTTGQAATGTFPVNLDVTGLDGATAPDVSTWGNVWFARYDKKTQTFSKSFSGTSYDDILNKIQAYYENHKGESDRIGLLRFYTGSSSRSLNKWAIWDLPSSTQTKDKTNELGWGKSAKYKYASAKDAVDAIRALTDAQKARLFNTLT